MPITFFPLRVLAMIANPEDAPAFDPEVEWQSLRDATDSLTRSGALELSRLESATEVALQRSLSSGSWHVLHFIGHGGAHGSRYGSLVFEGRGKRSRAVTAQHLGALLKPYEKLRLVVLQACREDENVLAEIGAMLVEAGVPAVLTTPRCSVGEDMAGFYRILLAGEPLQDAAAAVGARAQWALRSDLADGRIIPSAEEDAPAPPAPSTPKARPVDPRKTAEEAAERARKIAAEESARELERRRAAGQFDVFLCHNTSDKPAVKRIGRQLIERQILPWLDEWELQPGMAWQRTLEEQLGGIRAAAVFVGANGMGPWQRQELDGLLRQFVKRSCPVIPVLLPNAPSEPKLPLFLEGMTWVDFRVADPDPLDRFVWGITGKRGAMK